MKTQNILVSIVIFTVTLTSVLLSSSADAAVRSLSREQTNEVNGKRTTEVVVTCSGFSKKRVITRKDNGSIWCRKDAPDNCYSGKLRAARKACFSRSSPEAKNDQQNDIDNTAPLVDGESSAKESLANAEPLADKKPPENQESSLAGKEKLGPNGKSRAELMKEYIQIQEQRIVIEQQQIELNKRELQIQKRELAL